MARLFAYFLIRSKIWRRLRCIFLHAQLLVNCNYLVFICSHYDDHRFASSGDRYRPGSDRYRPGSDRYPPPHREDEAENEDPREQAKKLASSTRVMADLLDSAKTNRVVRPGGMLGSLFGEGDGQGVPLVLGNL